LCVKEPPDNNNNNSSIEILKHPNQHLHPTALCASDLDIMAILDVVTAPVSTILNTITSQAWQPLVSMCRNGTLAQLQNIKIGRLVLFEGGESKASTVFGADKEGVPVAFLDVHDEKFWVRLALFADMVCSLFATHLSRMILAGVHKADFTAGFC
jgi:hypothetical protein